MATSLNPEEKKRHAKDLYLQKNYGITIGQFDQLLAFQKGKCAICGKDLTTVDAKPNIDHDHRTRKLRGIVCNYDNHWVIGNLTMKQALAVYLYLATPPAVLAGFDVTIPKKKRKKKRTLVSSSTQGAVNGSTRRRTTRGVRNTSGGPSVSHSPRRVRQQGSGPAVRGSSSGPAGREGGGGSKGNGSAKGD
jgi:Recombination endonuclease VII